MRRCLTAIEGSFRIKKKYTYVYQFVEEKFRNYKLNYICTLLTDFVLRILFGVLFFKYKFCPFFFLN